MEDDPNISLWLPYATHTHMCTHTNVCLHTCKNMMCAWAHLFIPKHIPETAF